MWLEFIAQEWILFSILAVVVAAFLLLESRKGGASVSYNEATRRLNSDSAVVVDVREQGEFRAGHITGAVNIPYAQIRDKVVELEKFKSKQIIVVDKMGQHAGSAGKTLREKGFDVVRLQGGITEWTHQNLPLVKT